MKTSNSKIHWFNPGHENAVWTENPYYTPPATVCRLMADLALLPAWYGDDDDYVIVNSTDEASRFLSSLPAGIRPAVKPVSPSELNLSHIVEAAPWGLSPQSIRFFESLQVQHGRLLVPAWKEIYKSLTGRQTALKCLSEIRTLRPDYFETLTLPRFCSSQDEIRQFMAEYPPPYLLKTPFSCSGRGIFRIQTRSLDLPTTRWISGALRKQGVVSIERALDKVCDFAMEYESDGKGHNHFVGYGLFNTLSKGTYLGNMLGSRDKLEKQLTTYVPATQLHDIQDAVTSILTQVLGSEYRGYLGVDMLVYQHDNHFSIHPFIEINLRYTMGLVALQLSNRLLHPSSCGQLITGFNKDAYNTHLQMQTQFPLQLSGGKIHSGYLSLCPVTPASQYHAYIRVANI